MKQAPKNKWIRADAVRVRTVKGRAVIDIRQPKAGTKKKAPGRKKTRRRSNPSGESAAYKRALKKLIDARTPNERKAALKALGKAH